MTAAQTKGHEENKHTGMQEKKISAYLNIGMYSKKYHETDKTVVNTLNIIVPAQ